MFDKKLDNEKFVLDYNNQKEVLKWLKIENIFQIDEMCRSVSDFIQ